MQPDHWRFPLRSLVKTLSIAGAAVCLALGAATPAVAASGGTHDTSAKLLGVVRQTSSTTAEVHAQYRCNGGSDTAALWVSVKQSADRTADPRLANPGTGGGVDEAGNPVPYKAAAWAMSHRNAITCDGKNHVAFFTVDQAELPPTVDWGTLAKGKAYVQFCLFDANYTQAPLSVNEFLSVR